GQRGLARHGDVGVQAPVEPVDALEIGAHGLHRRELALANERGLPRGAEVDDVVAHECGLYCGPSEERRPAWTSISRSGAARSWTAPAARPSGAISVSRTGASPRSAR